MADLNALLTNEELQIFHDAERIGRLRALPEFNRIILVMQQAVEASRVAVELNRQPFLTAELVMRYQERKVMLDAVNTYIDSVVAKRRENLRDLFESLGIDPEKIDRNIDTSLEFLRMKGTNGHQ